MQLQVADYVICGVAVVFAILGLFRGFSGTLGFLLGFVAAISLSTFGWAYSVSLTETLWVRALATLVAALLAFGLVRFLVKRLVNGLLSQPTDAIFGLVTGVAFVAVLLALWLRTGIYTDSSAILAQVSKWL